LAVGSFLNCIIYRLEKNESFLKGRSYCPHCKHILSWKDLIPVLSFLILKGKCRYCGKRISLQYPLVELSTAILFFLIFNAAAFNLRTIYYLIIGCFLIIIFVYDLKHYLIPDKIIYPAIAITFIYRFFEILNFGNWDLFGIWDLGFGILKPILYPLASAIFATAFFLMIFLLSKGKWLGFGDVKLGFFMGLFLGFPNILVALFFAYFIGAIIGIGLILAKKKTLKSEVPFGPFLVAGTFIALFLGEKIINLLLP
jgi:prepilin signal peptidase PulO-like enzyme (type II secretory pathway)